jgi:hypothetical protein
LVAWREPGKPTFSKGCDDGKEWCGMGNGMTLTKLSFLLLHA